MKEIKYSTRVYIDPRNQQVYVRVRWNKKVEVAFALPIKADPTKWDEQLHRAKFNTIHKVGEQNCSARIVNGCIEEAIDKIKKATDCPDGQVFLLVGGTQTNQTVIDSILTKYEGVVSINVWSGYAICVTSKSGNREIVVGPATRLLDYDETLEAIKMAHKAGYTAISSHRSGETEDTKMIVKTAKIYA